MAKGGPPPKAAAEAAQRQSVLVLLLRLALRPKHSDKSSSPADTEASTATSYHRAVGEACCQEGFERAMEGCGDVEKGMERRALPVCQRQGKDPEGR